MIVDDIRTLIFTFFFEVVLWFSEMGLVVDGLELWRLRFYCLGEWCRLEFIE